MPLSKANQAKYMREYRQRLAAVIPKSASVIPNYLAQPNRYLLAHIKSYPDGFNPDGTYRDGYNLDFDPYINPLVRVCGA